MTKKLLFKIKEVDFIKLHNAILLILLLPIYFLWKTLYSISKWIYCQKYCAITMLIVLILFLGFRLLYVFLHVDPYHDSWFHVIAAMNFFDNFEFYKMRYDKEFIPYMRGSDISFVVALFYKMFEQALYIAKLVPTVIGFVNFILIYKICRMINLKRTHILLILFIIAICPWTIYNHIYIRMYIAYEFYLLLIIFLYIWLTRQENCTFKNKDIKVIVLPLLVCSLSYFFSNDKGTYAIALATFVGIIYIFLCIINKIQLDIKILKKRFNFSLSFWCKALVILFFVLSSIALLDIVNLFNFLLKYKSNTSPNNIKYVELFFQLNVIFSIFFILSLFLFLTLRNHKYNLLFVIGYSLFFIHLISNPGLQMIRAILYFLPVFFIISIFAYDRLSYLYNVLPKFLITIFMLLSIINNYPNNFIKYPGIPGETGFIEYSPLIHDFKHNFSDNTLIVAKYGLVNFLMYDINVNYQVDFKNNLIDTNNYYYNKKNELRNIGTNTKVITNKNHFYSICKNKNVSLILLPYSLKHFIDYNTNEFIKKNFILRNKYHNTFLLCESSL